MILKRNRNKDGIEYFYASQPCIIPLLTKEVIKSEPQKMSLKEAKAVARELADNYRANTIVDSILCIDGSLRSQILQLRRPEGHLRVIPRRRSNLIRKALMAKK